MEALCWFVRYTRFGRYYWNVILSVYNVVYLRAWMSGIPVSYIYMKTIVYQVGVLYCMRPYIGWVSCVHYCYIFLFTVRVENDLQWTIGEITMYMLGFYYWIMWISVRVYILLLSFIFIGLILFLRLMHVFID